MNRTPGLSTHDAGRLSGWGSANGTQWVPGFPEVPVADPDWIPSLPLEKAVLEGLAVLELGAPSPLLGSGSRELLNKGHPVRGHEPH